MARLAADFPFLIRQSTWPARDWKSNDGCRAIGLGYKRSPDRRSSIGKIAGMCENPHVDMDRPAVAELADVSAALARRVSVLCEDVYEVILQEIPQLNGDKPVLTLLASSVHGNVDTCLQVMQHRIDLGAVHAGYVSGVPVVDAVRRHSRFEGQPGGCVRRFHVRDARGKRSRDARWPGYRRWCTSP